MQNLVNDDECFELVKRQNCENVLSVLSEQRMPLNSLPLQSLERNWKMIRDEGLAVMDKGKGLFLPEEENLREKGDWSQFTLWQQGT